MDERTGKSRGFLSFQHGFLLFAVLASFFLPGTDAYAHGIERQGNVERPPYPSSAGRPDYDLPPPGSYRLPAIQKGVDGVVLDADGRKHSLFDLMAGRYVLLSFIYTGCYDPKGCPLAIHTLDVVREKLENDPAVSGKVVLLTLSFDPKNDTPEVMREFAEAHEFSDSRKQGKWLFLTTSSESMIRPILDGYGQYVVREYDETGRGTGGYSHVLKVFLIDPDRNVRNIYSTSFLNPGLIVNDIKTLIMKNAETHRDVP